jgi:phospholipid N-methyltransferase
MARSILKGIDFDKAKCVVELGAGTGPITAEILKRCPPTCRPLFLELDHDMAQRLRERFPAAEVVEGDAADLCEILSARGIDRVDAIVSGLPIPSIPDEIRHRILKSCSRALALGGHFRQLTVMPWIYYSMYRSYFEQVRFRFVPLNLPPGGWYDCQGYRR